MNGGDLKAKCATCAGAAGIASCTISMTLSAIGIAAIGLSQDSGMAGMSGASSTTSYNPSLLARLITFLSGTWGEIILIASFALMIFGMWSAKKTKPMIVAILGALILFFSMYTYFSIDLEIMGLAVLVLSYTSMYSRKFALFVKLA